MTDVLVSLRQRMPHLTSTERKVARTVLDAPHLVVSSTITELAHRCGTSAGTVARMCRAIGFSGYRDFRIEMASAVGREQQDRHSFRVSDAEISPADTVGDLVAKVAYQEVKAIEDTARNLDYQVLDAACTAVLEADKIDLFGVGSSALIARDLHQKLHRIGLISFCWEDIHLAVTSVAISDPSNVAIGVSYSGTTVETVKFLQTANSRGAHTIAITNFPDSPVGKQASSVLTTSAHDTGLRAGAMASRIAQMAVVDFLLVRIVQEMLPEAERLLRTSYAALEDFKVAPSRDQD